MTARTPTKTAFVPAAPRRTGLLARLLNADARYREAQAMKRLTAEQRRDMGLPESGGGRVDARRANLRFLDGEW